MSHGQSLSGSSGRTRLVYTAAIACLFGGLLFGYDTGNISGALLCIREDFALTPFLQGLVVSSLPIGAMVGALACGRPAEAFGRRRLALIAAVIFGLSYRTKEETVCRARIGRILRPLINIRGVHNV